MIRIIVISIAVLLFIIGIITLPTPVPIGLIFLGISLSLLVMVSQTVRNWLLRIREKNPSIDKFFTRAEDYLPGILKRALQKSAPHRSRD